jgi:predicted TPR repeat methyltransferase
MDFQAVMQLMQAGRFADAASQCQAFLRKEPQHPGALCLAGICLAELGQADKAMMALELATMLAPEFADAHRNLGLLYLKADRLEEAEQRFRQVIAHTPPAAGSYVQLAMVLARLGRNAEAIEAFQIAVRFDPNEPAFHKMLGDTLYNEGRAEEAMQHHDQAIKNWRGAANATFFEHMWRMYTAHGQTSSAADLATKWLQLDPSNAIAQHCLAASGGTSAPTRASDGYVQGTFDAFADSYDEQLAALENRGPTLIAQAVKDLGSTPVNSVLDAGCGTGLCGPALRPLAKKLVGLDLSGKMLDKARALNIYDTLIEAELCSYLESQPSAFDWIVSGDTFCYFGDLATLTRAALKALRPKGQLIFTIERAADRGPEDSFTLLPQGRYCHGDAYVDRALREAGFAQIKVKHESLRKEGTNWVPCLVVTAQA